MAHDQLEHCHKQIGAHPTFISGKPETTLGVDGGSRRDRLALAWNCNDRRLALHTPCPASHRISTKPRFIPEIDLRAIAFGRSHNARIPIPLPIPARFQTLLLTAHPYLPCFP